MLARFGAVVLMFATAHCFAASSGSQTLSDPVRRILELSRRATVQEGAGDFAGAADLYLQAADQSGALGMNPEFRSRLLADCADAYEHSGAWLEAASILRKALEWAESRFGAADERTASIQTRLASTEVMLGQLDSAATRLRGSLEVQQNAPTCRRSEVTLALITLAVVDLNQDRLSEGERLASSAIAMNEARGPDTPELGDALGVLAGIYLAGHDPARALPLLTRSIDILGQPAISSIRVAPLLVERGIVEADGRKFTLAEEDLERAIRILDSGSGANVNADWPRVQLATIYMADEKLDRADAILPDAVDRQRTFLGKGRRLAFYIRQLARLRGMQKRYREAGALYRECLTMVGIEPQGANHRSASEKDIRRLEHEAQVAFGSPPAG